MKAFKLDPMNSNNLQKEAEDFKAIMFFLHSYQPAYSALLTHLEQNAIVGQNGYPTTASNAYHLLNCKLITNLCTKHLPGMDQNPYGMVANLMFFQHVFNDSLGNAVQFVQLICNHWVLLDTRSTCSVMNNHSFVSNVIDCTNQNRLTVCTNGGMTNFEEMGTFI